MRAFSADSRASCKVLRLKCNCNFPDFGALNRNRSSLAAAVCRIARRTSSTLRTTDRFRTTTITLLAAPRVVQDKSSGK